MVSIMRDIIICYRDAPKESDIETITNLGGTIKIVYSIIKAVAAVVPEEAIDTLRRQPNIECIEIDEKVYAHIPIGTCQEVKILEQIVPWGINRIGSRLVNTIDNTGQGIKIAILDTGIDYTHPDLARNYKGGYNVFTRNVNATDDNGHGTHIAGIIAAVDNDIGVVGVAPDAHIYSVKVLDYAAIGSTSDILAGLEWSIENNMQIINMSLGSCEDSIAVQRAVDEAYRRGILLISAAGNSGNKQGSGDNVDNPARYSAVMAVGAIDKNDKRTWFSSTGPSLEISAPGADIYSTLPGGKYGSLTGTSMAAPHVAGVAALVMRADPRMTNVQVRIRLQTTTQNIAKGVGFQAKNWYGYGLVDAVKAVS